MMDNATESKVVKLEADWFEGIMPKINQLIPFSFWIKRDGVLIFSSNGTENGYLEENLQCEDTTLTLGISRDVQKCSLELKETFVQLLQLVLNSQSRVETEMKSFSAELLNRYEELNILYELSQTIGSVFDLDKIFEVLIEKIEIVLDVDRISIMLFDEEAEELIVIAAKGFDVKQLENHRISLKEGISGYVLRRGEPLLVQNGSKIPNDVKVQTRDYKTESFISVPMICSHIEGNEIPIGVINVTEKRNTQNLTSGDLKLLNSVASIAAIAIYNNRLIEAAKESERMKKELEIAEKIQLGLLPNHFPVLPDLEIYGRCWSATNIGGDYFDFYIENEDRVDLVIADVSGHNVSAALMMAVTRSVLKSLMQESIPVSEVLNRANRSLFEDLNRAGFFISIFLIRYNRKTKELTYANGGHHPVMWYRGRTKEINQLDAEGLLLGVLSEVQFQEKSVTVESEDILVMYTDGLVEIDSPEGVTLDYDKLKNDITHSAQESAKELVKLIFEGVQGFNQITPQKDDLTLQVLKIK